MKRRASAILAVGSLLVAAPARAAPRAIAVSSDGCAALRPAEVERILGVELAEVTARWSGPEPLRVELTCDADRVRIVAIDPVTDKRLSREVELGVSRAGADRTVALLVSQLFLTSWSELLLAPREDAPAPEPARPAFTPAVVHAAERLTRAAIAPSSRQWELDAFGGPRLRDLRAPMIGVRAGLRPSLLLGPARLGLDIGYESGSADRVSGRVAYSLVGASLVGGWRSPRVGPLAFDLGASGGVAYTELHGDAAASAIGSSAHGVVGEASTGAGPTLFLGSARVSLGFEGGLTFPRAVGRVSRDDDVAINGAWVGAALRLGIGGWTL